MKVHIITFNNLCNLTSVFLCESVLTIKKITYTGDYYSLSVKHAGKTVYKSCLIIRASLARTIINVALLRSEKIAMLYYFGIDVNEQSFSFSSDQFKSFLT